MAHVPQDVLDRIAALEREVRTLRGRSQIRPAMNQVSAGPVTVAEGGFFQAIEPGGNLIFATGQWDNGRYGVSLRRSSGPIALDVDADATGNGMIRVLSRSGNVLIHDDAHSPDYLGRPWVPIPMGHRVDFTGTGWTNAFAGYWWVQHAVLVAYYSVFAPPEGTVEARLVMGTGDNPTPIGPTITARNGASAYASERITVGEHRAPYGSIQYLRVQARRTAGTGTGSVWCTGLWGVQTATPDEAQ